MSRFDNEPFTLSRDVDAVIVPAGINVKLRTGQSGFITQALGGSFTVYVEGNLFRVAGKDADALGKELAAVPELPPDASDADVRELAWQQMKTCYDPEIPINIVDLGLVYSCEVRSEPDGRVKTSAAWLIEQAGFHKGYGNGRAGISTKHTLALVNRGGASTAELMALAHEIAAGVDARFGVALHPEPVLVGHSW